jgi:lipopolysaccharide transport system ATP-binding protein
VTEPLVVAHGLGKMYRIYDRPSDRLRQMLTFGRRRYGQEFWALQGVDLEVRPGEVVGILGRNGMGKSTLLQLLAGILTPTTGSLQRRGRVAALLELGSGFNPDFTGRENVFLNAAVLGLSEEETRERLPAIEAFAEIDRFLDQPVKTYSSGMFMRLAFAVATTVDAALVLIDEALAVGDVFFRQKCYRRLQALRDAGVGIVLVSHATNEIEQFCDRALVLDGGRVAFTGDAREAVKRYYLVEEAHRSAGMRSVPGGGESVVARPRETAADTLSDARWPPAEAFLDLARVTQVSAGAARCLRVAVCDPQGRPCRVFPQGETASFFYEFEVAGDAAHPFVGVVLYNDKGLIVHAKNSLLDGVEAPDKIPAGTRLRVQQDVRLDLDLGEYTFELGLASMPEDDHARRASLAPHEIYANVTRLAIVPGLGPLLVTVRQPAAPLQVSHHGVADLPGHFALALVPAAAAASDAERPLTLAEAAR